MSESLPAWATYIQPVGMDDAATLLGMSRRKLSMLIQEHPYYSMGGRAKVFYPDDIAKLREVIRCRTNCANALDQASGRSKLPSADAALDEALARVTRNARRKKRSNSNSKNGNVIALDSKKLPRSHTP